MKDVRLIAVALLLAFAGPTFGADDAATARFRALEEAWSNAIKAQDAARIERFLSPDFTLIVAVAGRPLDVVDRASWLRNAGTGYVVHEFEFKDLIVREYGDTAVVSAHYTQKATVNGRDRSGDFFVNDVWVKAGDQWQVSTRYSSRPHPGKPSPPAAPSSR